MTSLQRIPFEVNGVSTTWDGGDFSSEQIEVIKQTVAKGVSDAELKLFVEVCQRTRLSPFARQIYAIKRRQRDGDGWREAMTIQTGIDGFRLLAERTGKYKGRIGPEWAGKPRDENAPTVWRTEWLYETPPFAARVGVWHRDWQQPLWAVALWKEYVQSDRDGKPTGLWGKMPSLMLAKCAEAAALRGAFPAELSRLELMPDAVEYERQARARVEDVYSPDLSELRVHAGATPHAIAAPQELADIPHVERPEPVAARRSAAATEPETPARSGAPASRSAEENMAMTQFWQLERELKRDFGWTDADTLTQFSGGPAIWAKEPGNSWAAALQALRTRRDELVMADADQADAGSQAAEAAGGCPGCGSAEWQHTWCPDCGLNEADIANGELPGMPPAQAAASRRGAH